VNPAVRNGSALFGALLISFGLFWVMYQLVLGGEARRAEVTSLPTIDFVRVQRQDELETRQRVRPERPPPPERPPTPPRVNVNAQAPSAPAALSLPGLQTLAVTPNLKGGPFIGEFTPDAGGGGDAELVPLVRVPPQYPRAAARAGITGVVTVQVTVGPDGRVQDAQIVKADPRGYFEQAALRSARQSQFRPRIVGGEPVTQTGTYDIVFTLESR
jgi:periplasmic protein TonB